jgi:hypothetical protein
MENHRHTDTHAHTWAAHEMWEFQRKKRHTSTLVRVSTPTDWAPADGQSASSTVRASRGEGRGFFFSPLSPWWPLATPGGQTPQKQQERTEVYSDATWCTDVTRWPPTAPNPRRLLARPVSQLRPVPISNLITHIFIIFSSNFLIQLKFIFII